MQKLKLRLDDLAVESFDTTRREKANGTVFGEQCTCYTQCTCPGCPTCDASCNGTCNASCNGTCAGTCDASCDGGCTWDYTCTNNSCVYTCQGWVTYGDRGMCVECAGGVFG